MLWAFIALRFYLKTRNRNKACAVAGFTLKPKTEGLSMLCP